jgi:transcription factor STE12
MSAATTGFAAAYSAPSSVPPPPPQTRHTYAGASYASGFSSAPAPAPTHAATMPIYSSHAPGHSHGHGHAQAPAQASSYPHAQAQAQVQAQAPGKPFTCELFSCGRAFKRAEHLRRHVRTHTAERPFGCPRCAKRFARSDNLAQHARTHERADAEGVEHVDDGVYVDEDDEVEGDGDDAEGNQAETEGEGEEESEDGSAYSHSHSHSQDAQLHHQVAAVDIRDPYFAGAASAAAQYTTGVVPSPTQYATAAAPADWQTAFPSVVTHLRQQGPSPQMPYRYASPASYDTAGASLSAPAHKLSFDHAAPAPYPASLLQHQHQHQQQQQRIGPVRRPRSVTPNLARAGESIRRPLTASIPDYAASASAPVPRGYHPYAAAYHHSATASASGSAHSSPARGSVPLAYHSRRSSGDAPPMLGLQPDAAYAAAVYTTDYQDSPPSEHEGALPDQGMYMLGLDVPAVPTQQQQQSATAMSAAYYALAGQVEPQRHVTM